MPFRPYHRFQNRASLETVITELKAVGNITDTVYNGFHRYHPAMMHKLRSAKYYVDNLTEKLSTTNVQEAADATSDFMFEVNMFIDGFFYNAGSSMDILARVVLTLFGQPLTGNIYFNTAHTRINQAKPNDPILPRLELPPWRQCFLDYRNTLAHELILASKFHIDIDNTGPKQVTRIVFPLPDDPRAEPTARSYKQNPNVVDYATNHFRRILSMGNIIYGDIVTKARASGALPL